MPLPPPRPTNLALALKASASETLDDLTPEKAIDGKQDTRWSGIPGHNEGVWFQLDWKEPVEVGEVVVHQYDTFAMEWDVQVREENSSEWRTIRHFGKPGEKLPKVVTCNFSPLKIIALRIGNITNGPSFNEVAGLRPALRRRRRDQRGFRSARPFSRHRLRPVGRLAHRRRQVTLSGKSKGGPWQTSATERRQGPVLPPTCRWGLPVKSRSAPN